MLKKENPKSLKRHAMCRILSEKGVSFHTRAEITECMGGKTDSEKEQLAEQLLEIISTSSTEEEMINKAKKLQQTI